MRRSPQDSGRLPAPLLLILALCMLFIMLTPVASALSNTRESDDTTLAVSVMCGGENGKVTDDDGIIGNGRRGVDRAPLQDEFANGIQDSTMPSPRVWPDSADGAQGMGGSRARSGNGTNVIEENGTADDGNSSGILPWIIAAIVAVSVVLVVLALIPRKNKSR